MSTKKIYLASPRGFCAGVKRALTIVETALEKYGTPLYVFHEIVHNDYIVKSLSDRGVIFVNTIEEVPIESNIIYSAHGVSISVEEGAKSKSLNTIDASCPLVKKVHTKAQKLSDAGYRVLLIGHKSHPEVVGTVGQISDSVTVIENISCVEQLDKQVNKPLAFLTQTTLSSDDTKDIVSALYKKFPNIKGENDICYATQNRQDAMKELVKSCDTIFVIGSVKSSNSNRLKEVAQNLGCSSYLINSVDDLTTEMYSKSTNIGISAGASAPECLVDDLVNFFRNNGWSETIIVDTAQENIKFTLPTI